MKSPKMTKILIVDDEVYMREIIIFDLQKHGYQVSEADSGTSALELIKNNKFDLVISDVRMPAGTGVELLQWIKEIDPLTPSFIFMTAFSDISADEALDLGAEAFITKPLARDLLIEKVQKATIERKDRWVDNIPEYESACKIYFEYNKWDTALNQPQVILGNGGFFLEMENDFPDSLEIIGFDIPISKESKMRLRGYGRVRWVRQEGYSKLIPGIGLEFLYLCQTSRDLFLNYLTRSPPKSYIPLGYITQELHDNFEGVCYSH